MSILFSGLIGAVAGACVSIYASYTNEVAKQTANLIERGPRISKQIAYLYNTRPVKPEKRDKWRSKEEAKQAYQNCKAYFEEAAYLHAKGLVDQAYVNVILKQRAKNFNDVDFVATSEFNFDKQNGILTWLSLCNK